MTQDIKRVAVIGTGVIGSSWTSYFLAHGLHVTATDPSPGAEERLRATVASHWPVLQELGLAEGASLDNLLFVATAEEAVQNADFVQENGPEREDLKKELFAVLDAAARPDVVLATSSSGLPVTNIQAGLKHPERVLVGHPFNPPHLIPLVEVVAGDQTGEKAVLDAINFYTAIGKKPLQVKQERLGFIANRLQAALWREAFALLAQGSATVEDIDLAISQGPGLRWALTGPFLNMHLSGGAGGIAHVLKHLGPPMEVWWDDLGHVPLSDELNAKIIQGVEDEKAGRSDEDITRKRDKALLELLKLKNSLPEI